MAQSQSTNPQSSLSESELKEYQELLEQQMADGLDNVHPYDWQTRFIAATRTYRECMLMASNRTGKTYLGTWVDAIHSTGRYTQDWPGHKFRAPPTSWLLGYSGPKCRDLLQKPMFGTYSNGKFSGSALVSPDQIIASIPSGVSGLADSVTVKWHDPEGRMGEGIVQFKSYSQGQHALMGDKVDWFHIDEEPKDHKIYPQVITRTADGDQMQGGRGILTFTPENGRTEMVVKFMDDPGKHQYLQIATFDDAYHLTEETKEALLDSWPDYQRSMRSRGVPLMGVGLIYEHDVEALRIDAFNVPDYWYVINGMDIGWDHPQAHIQLVWDKDHDVFYVTRAWKARRKQPFEAWHAIKSWAEHVPTAWPHDGLQTEKGSGKPMKNLYAKEGWNMLPEHATWETGGYHVEPGLMEINSLMGEGRFKIGRMLTDVTQEIERYHRIDTGMGTTRIVKVDDDLLDAIRAAYMMRRHAVRICDLIPREGANIPRKVIGRDARRGY